MIRLLHSDLLISKKINILAVTETWFRPHDIAACIADISPLGYTFYHRSCLIGRGSGIGFLISEHFKVKLHSNPDYSSFQFVC